MLQTTSSLSHETKAMILESRFIRTNIAQFNENFNPKKVGAANRQLGKEKIRN